MGTRAVLHTGAAFIFGTLLGLYLYTYSYTDILTMYQADTSMVNYSLTFYDYHNNNRTHLLNNGTSNENIGRRPLDSKTSHQHESMTTSLSSTNHSISAPSQVPTSPKYVLILAYMRSGSTLTGDVIQENNKVIYTFEPLYNIWRGHISTFSNGRNTVHAKLKDKIAASLVQLKAWFTCDLANVEIQSLGHFFLTFGKKYRNLRRCLRKYPTPRDRTTWVILNKRRQRHCVEPFMKKQCKPSPVRVIKTIRMTANNIEPLFKSLPGLKVIHLVRDPRGILSSRKEVDVRGTIGKPFFNVSMELCHRIMRDYEKVGHFEEEYPGQIMHLRYEELATYPEDTIERIYRFIGLNTTRKIFDAISSFMSSEKNVEKHFNTARKNSVRTANAWRLKMKYNVTQMIDSVCSDVYDKYGYINVSSSEQLTNIDSEILWERNITTWK